MKQQLKSLIDIFRYKPSDYQFLNKEIERIYKIIPTDFGGGCSRQKGLLMSLLISEMNLKATVDIGVYRGRSLFPQAIAHNSFSNGVVYGVDPYSNEAAIQNDRPDLKKALDNFVDETNFNDIYDFVKNLVKKEEFQDSCKLVREKSIDAAVFFKENNLLFDLIHIDGNHDTSFVLKDVEHYLPLLKEKGFIVLDDISWESVKPAYNILKKQINLVDELINESNDFALFSKGLNRKEQKHTLKIFRQVRK